MDIEFMARCIFCWSEHRGGESDSAFALVRALRVQSIWLSSPRPNMDTKLLAREPFALSGLLCTRARLFGRWGTSPTLSVRGLGI